MIRPAELRYVVDMIKQGIDVSSSTQKAGHGEYSDVAARVRNSFDHLIRFAANMIVDGAGT
jgi:hypothetical protein